MNHLFNGSVGSGKRPARTLAAEIDVRGVRRMYGLAAATLFLLLSTLILAGCGGNSNASPGTEADVTGRVVRVETLLLNPTPFEDVVQITGTVAAVEDAVLSAQSAGSVTFLAPLGRVVRAGQVIAQLDPVLVRSAVDQAKAGVEAAEAQFELAEDNMKRNAPLYRDSVISAIEYENVRAQLNRAKADLSQARAMLAQADEQLRQTRVTAPFSGSVESHFVEIGEQVQPGRQIARIINMGRVKVTAGVPERYAADIRVGTPVQVDFKAYRGVPVQGRVSFVGNAINPQNRTFPVEVLLENRSGAFKPEMIAQVLVTREEIEKALVIPRSAVIRDEDGNSVFLVRKDGDRMVATKRSVVLGSARGGEVVVTNLQAGDELVVLGQASLTPGDRVQIMERHNAANDPELSDSANATPESSN